jgi:hypothetical protein
MSFLTRSQRDDLRTALLGELVAAREVALSAEMLARRVTRSRLLSFDFDLQDVQSEIEALHTRGFLQVVKAGVATTPHYQASTTGVATLDRQP